MKLITEINVLFCDSDKVVLQINQGTEDDRTLILDHKILTLYSRGTLTLETPFELVAGKRKDRRKAERRRNILRAGRREQDRRA